MFFGWLRIFWWGFFKQHVLIEICWFMRVFFDFPEFYIPPEPCSENLENIFTRKWQYFGDFLLKFSNMLIFVIFLQVRHQIGVPYHHGKTEKTSGINRSREVHIPRYQQFFSTPNSQKVRAVPRFAKSGTFFSETFWILGFAWSRFTRLDFY